MKKKIPVLFLVGVLLLSLAACGRTDEGIAAPADVPAAGMIPLAAAVEPSGFSDVPAGAAYAQAVAWCVEKNLMNGVGNNRFDPDGALDRRTLATVLYRDAGKPAVTAANRFSDVETGQWYTDAAIWADAQGLITGYGGGVFGPTRPVTRVEMDVIFQRYQGKNPIWPGDPTKTSASRAEVAVALHENLNKEETAASDKPAVYMTADISAAGLTRIYQALGAAPSGKVAVKLSTGENGSNYLRPELIGDLVKSLNATIVECNTAYGGNRASTAMHKQLAADHGYTAIANVDIMDEEGSMTLQVNGGDNLTENYVGSHFAGYDYYVVLSHFKGHAMAGFGGAIKNISIGIASSRGKSHIHTGGKGGSMWSADQDAFLESMAEAGKSVVDALDGNILYINVMNRLSVDCDCDGSPAEPDMHDIGILASFDPVAVDQACVDLVYAAEDGANLIRRIESRNGLHTLEQAAKIGLGSREYELVNIDARQEATAVNKLNVSFHGKRYTATLANNSSAEALKALLQKNGGSVTIAAHDYSSFEKVGDLPEALPRNDEPINTVPGDLILYQGRSICLYYSTNSWNFTRLGKLDGDLSSLKSDLGGGDVEITWSIP